MQDRLPWVATAAALVVYLATLNHWIRLESLPTVAKITGWDWTPSYHAPLLFLITYPFRWLPAAVQPAALNVLAALLAALTLGLLCRSVALLPYDRTREERMRERHEMSLLSVSRAWLPPLFAVLLCGLQLTFWEHATALTGEMLDALIFAWLVRCLLEYRLTQKEVWLTRLALSYGVAVTNNYAMIGFFPCFVVALVWVKGLGFFRLAFLGRMLACGGAGLVLYLLLPLVAVASHQTNQGFWSYLRTVWGYQRSYLLAFPPYVILLLSFTSLFPLLVRSIRWPSNVGDTNVASAQLATFITRVVHLLLLAACVSVVFDPKWSPRALGFGMALLPFYYLSALAAGYLAGYFLLLYRDLEGKAWMRPTAARRLLNRVVREALLLVFLVAPAVLAYRNLPVLRSNDGRALAQLADLTLETLPAKAVYFISDDATELLLAEAALHRKAAGHPHVPINSRLLDSVVYHEHMAKRYPQRWALPPNFQKLPEPLDTTILVDLLNSFVRSNEVYYLHPSMGYFFESLYAEPHGLLQRLRSIPTNSFTPPPLGPEVLAENRKFWDRATSVLSGLPRLTSESHRETRFIGEAYSRALNYWGVVLQRHGAAGEAGKALALANEINPENFPAKVNLEFNQELKKGPPRNLDVNQPAEIKSEQRRLDELLLQNGPFDNPLWCFKLGQVYAQGSLFRQALIQFQRVCEILPENVTARVWRENMTAMTRFTLGETAAAEQMALALRQSYPREDSVLETLTQIYLMSSRPTNALATIDEQLQLNSANQRALLNKAAISIHIKAFEQAIPALDKLLSLQPDNSAALMNRAIATLQSGKLDLAERDYEALRKQLPRYHAVYYGLAEVAYRKKDHATALRNYERYLRYASSETQEYKEVAQRVKELKSGGARR